MRGGPASRLALAAIRGYQRWISPHKGYRCALCAVTGGESCSNYAFRVIERFGLRRGLGLLDRRFELCGHVHRTFVTASPAPAVRNPWRHKEQGECDTDCITPCDGDCSWEWGETRRREQERKRSKADMDAAARRIARHKKKQPPTSK